MSLLGDLYNRFGQPTIAAIGNAFHGAENTVQQHVINPVVNEAHQLPQQVSRAAQNVGNYLGDQGFNKYALQKSTTLNTLSQLPNQVSNILPRTYGGGATPQLTLAQILLNANNATRLVNLQRQANIENRIYLKGISPGGYSQLSPDDQQNFKRIQGSTAVAIGGLTGSVGDNFKFSKDAPVPQVGNGINGGLGVAENAAKAENGVVDVTNQLKPQLNQVGAPRPTGVVPSPVSSNTVPTPQANSPTLSTPTTSPAVKQSINGAIKVSATKANVPGKSLVSGMRNDGTFGPLSEQAAQATVRALSPGVNGSPGMPPQPFLPTGTIKDALHAYASIDPSVNARATFLDHQLNTLELSNKLGKTELGHNKITELINQAKEHPENIQEYANQTKTPDLFKQTLQEYSNFTDYLHELHQKVGSPLGYRDNYLRHNVDLTTPEAQQKFSDIAGMTIGKDFQPGYKKLAMYKTVDELRANGLDIKKESASTALRSLAQDNIHLLRGVALKNAVNRAYPNGAIDIAGHGGIPYGYSQSRIPGLEGTAFSPEAQKYLRNLEPADEAGKVGKVYDWANRVLKETALSLGGFHPLNILNRFESSAIGTGKIKPSLSTIGSFFSDSVFDPTLKKYIEDGTVDLSARIGVKLSGGTRPLNSDNSYLARIAQGGNVFRHLNNATFRRFQDAAAIKLVNLNKEELTRLVNSSDPLDREKAYEFGKQVNSVILTVNRSTVLANPNVMRWIGRVMLAPDVIRAKVAGVVGATTKGGPGGNLARGRIIAAIIIGGVLAEVSHKLVTGEWHKNIKDVVEGDIVDPGVSLPYKNDKGIQQVVKLPTNEVSEFGRPILGTAQGDTTAISRYISARVAALPGIAAKVSTNTDYYGNPVVNPFNKPNPSLLDKAIGVAKTQLPIAVVQANKTAAGQPLPTSILNSVGFRVGNDVTDPKQVSNTVYYNNRDTFTKNLNPNNLAVFNAVNPIKKDQDGNQVFDKTAITSAANAGILASRPDFAQDLAQFQRDNGSLDPIYKLSGDNLIKALQARSAVGTANKDALNPNSPSVSNASAIYYKNFDLFKGTQALQQLAGKGNYDPIYDLPDSQAKQALGVSAANALFPGSSSQIAVLAAIKKQPWYKDFQASRSAYYTSHPIPASAGSNQNPYPEMPSELSNLANQISQAASSADKARLYATPLGKQLDAYYAQLDQYNTQKQATLLGTQINVAAGKYSPGYTATPDGITPVQTTGSQNIQKGTTPSMPNPFQTAGVNTTPQSGNVINIPAAGTSTTSQAGWDAYNQLKAKNRIKSTMKLIKSKEAKIGKVKKVKQFKTIKVKAHVRKLKISKPKVI